MKARSARRPALRASGTRALALSAAALVLCTGAAAWAGEVSVDLSFDAAKLRLARAGKYTRVELPDTRLPYTTPGTPWLPARFVNVLIPAGATALDVRATADERRVAAGVVVLPAQPPTPKSRPAGPFVPPDALAYASVEKTPAALAVLQSTQYFRGYALASVRINPVRYVPALKELSLASRIRVTVTYQAGAKHNAAPAKAAAAARRILSGLVLNPGDAARFAPAAFAAKAGKVDYDYLLITHSVLSSAFQALVDRRNGQGLAAILVTTDTINATYPGVDLQQKIRNCITDYYQNSNVTYVCLGGDSTVVVDRDCYVAVGGTTEFTMPTDLYYGGLDGTWDSSGNGVYGEAGVDTDVDLTPEVWVGRIPVRTSGQATDYISKLIAYESASPQGFAHSMLLLGVEAWNTYDGDDRPSDFLDHDPVSDSEIWIQRLYWDTIQPSWQAVPMRLLFDTLSTWDTTACGNYNLIASNLSTQFNTGYNHVYMETHGSTQTWAMEGGASFHSSDAAALTNGSRASIIYTVACETGGFDQPLDPSLSEAFLRNANGGAVVYMGCSRYGWGSPGSYAGGPSNDYSSAFYQQTFGNGRDVIGEAFAYHKMDMASASGNNDPYRWIQFGMNLQGDPAITMWRDETGRKVEVASPNGCESYYTGTDATVRWNAAGTGFAPGDTVRLDVSSDGGSQWAAIAGASSLAYNARSFTWDTSGMTPSSQYRLRVTCNQAAVTVDVSDRNFTLAEHLDIVTPSPLPAAQLNGPYSVTLQAQGGVQPYSWSVNTSYEESDPGSGWIGAGVAQGWSGDDFSNLVNLQWPFPFYGTNYSSVYVCSNGFVDFVSSTTDYSPSEAELASNVRICPLWYDLYVRFGTDNIYIAQSPTYILIRWACVTLGGSDPVNVELMLFPSGDIKINYGAAHTGIYPTVGVSKGDGQTYTLTRFNQVFSIPANQSSMLTFGGLLPAGLALNSISGEIYGTPTEAGTTTVGMLVQDVSVPRQTATKSFSLSVVPARLLTLSVDPAGSGTVTANPAGPAYPPGSVVTLTAVPNLGWSFGSWSGDATGTANPLQILMDSDKQVAAHFGALGRDFYVNDGSQADDVYCTAVGSDANDGLSPDTPKRTIKAIIDTYDLDPGDRVYIDTGVYSPAMSIFVGAQDFGGAGAGNDVAFIGSTRVGGTVITGNGFLIGNPSDNNAYVTISQLRITAAHDGVLVQASHATLSDLICDNNGQSGVFFNSASDGLVERVTCYSNATYGIMVGFAGSSNCTVRNVLCYDNWIGVNFWFTSNGTLRNATCCQNSFGVAIGSSISVANCILWANDVDLSGGSATYSCIEGGGFGTGNISENPLFVDPDNVDFGLRDYHVRSQGGHWTSGGWVVDAQTSPCVDAGDPASGYADEPLPNGGRINMGAYGNTAQASRSGIAYTLVVTKAGDGDGQVRVNGTLVTLPYSESFAEGTVVTLEALAGTGATFTGWGGDLGGSTNPTAITMDGNKTVAATFELSQHTLTLVVDPPLSGAITASPSLTAYSYGTVVTLSVASAAGWQFGAWSGDASGSATTTVLTIVADAAVTASFSHIPYTLSAVLTPPGAGTLTVDPRAATYTYGTQVTLTASPSTRYELALWQGKTTPDPAGPSTTFTATANPLHLTIDGHKAVTATCALVRYVIDKHIDPAGTGTITANPAGPDYEHGSVVTLTAAPGPGWLFGSWSGDAAGSNPVVTLTMDGDKAVTASFNAIPYTITKQIDPPGAGTITLNPEQATYIYGTVVTATAAPNTSWALDRWSDDASGRALSSVLVVDGDKTVTAHFDQIAALTLSVSSSLAGTTTPAPGSYTCTAGTVVTLTATPNAGYRFAGWLGGAHSPSSTLTTVTMNVDRHMIATFVRQYTLTMAVDDALRGSTSPAVGLHVYDEGTVVTVTGAANTGWRFDHWVGDVADTGQPATTVTVDQDKTATAHFVQTAVLTMYVDPPAGGATSPTVGVHINDRGTTVPVAATATIGYQFDGWQGNVANSSASATSVTLSQDEAVTATFSLVPYTIARHVLPPGSGTITLSPSQSWYAYGTVVTLTAVPNPGKAFHSWAGDVSGTSPVATLTVYGNRSVTASFSAIPYTLTTAVVPGGAGLVDVNPSAATYTYGTVVTLTAQPNLGWAFENWQGDASGTATVATVVMDADRSVTATFYPVNVLSLRAGGSGSGSVEVDGAPHLLPFSATFRRGSQVNVLAVPGPASTFTVWSGDAFGSANPIKVIMDRDKVVTANFELLHTVTLTKAGPADGQVDVNGVLRTLPYTAIYIDRDALTLTAVPAQYAAFDDWTGSVTSTANPLVLSVLTDLAITATFQHAVYDLVLTKGGNGTGVVSVNAAQHALPYTEGFIGGTVVSLTAEPTYASSFVTWEGALTTTQNPVTLTMTSPKSVTANFLSEAGPFTLTVTKGGLGAGQLEVNGTAHDLPFQQAYVGGTMLALRAVALGHDSFTGWDGAWTGTTNPIQVPMTWSHTLVANFAQEPGQILGAKWHDMDANGQWGTGEVGLPDWTIYLDQNLNGQLDPGERATTTTADGSYFFAGLAAGTYYVAEVIPAQWEQIHPLRASTGGASLCSANPVQPAMAQAASLIRLDEFRADPRFAGVDGRGYSAVIIDTGVDADHPFFGPDADANGVADRIAYQFDFADKDKNANDPFGGGTHLASIVGSQDTQYTGIAPRARLIVLKVVPDSGKGDFRMVEAALQWVVANVSTYNIASVCIGLSDNGNYGKAGSLYGLGDELAALASRRVIVAAPSGDGFFGFGSAQGGAYPAIDPNVVGVAAVYDGPAGYQNYADGAIAFTTAADRVTPFSQRHPSLTAILAPGAVITGADIGGGIGHGQGSNRAAAQIAGVAVLAQQWATAAMGRRLTTSEFVSLMQGNGASVQDGDDEDDNVTNTDQTFQRVDMMGLAEGILAQGTLPGTYRVFVAPGGQVPNVNFGNRRIHHRMVLSKSGNGEGQVEVAGTLRALPYTGEFLPGTVVTLTAAPTGDSYFVEWHGDLAGVVPSATLTMNGPVAVTAEFGTNIQVLFSTEPRGLEVYVDGLPRSTPYISSWRPGMQHAVGVDSPQSFGTQRYVYAKWSDGQAQWHTITAPKAPAKYGVSFTTELLVTVAVSPTEAGVAGLEPAAEGGWYLQGAKVSFSAKAHDGWTFSHWYFSGKTTATNPIVLPVAKRPISGVAHMVAATDGLARAVPIAPVGAVPAGPLAFRWQGVPEAASYEMWVSAGASRVDPVLVQKGLSQTQVGPVAGLDGDAYVWWVKAKAADGRTSWSVPAEFARYLAPTAGLPAPKPIAPVGAAKAGGVTFTWTEAPGAASYDLWVGLAEGKEPVCRKTDLAGTACKLQLKPGAYRWAVRASTAGAASPWSPLVAVTVK